MAGTFVTMNCHRATTTHHCLYTRSCWIGCSITCPDLPHHARTQRSFTMQIKQSFSYRCFIEQDQSLDDLCERAATIGYAALELTFRNEQFQPLVAAARKAGLVVASMCGHKSLTVGMNQRSEHDRIEKELQESIQI